MSDGSSTWKSVQNLPLVLTKIGRPRAGGELVARPRLVEKLNRGLHRGSQLSLICAPAGYGKTTLIGEWLLGLQRPQAWLSLDEGDNDPVSFLAYLAAALRRVDDQLGQSVGEAVSSDQTPPSFSQVDVLTATLINDMANTPEPFVLVLDDYHLIQEAAIHRALTSLVDNQPDQIHLAIISRADPPIGIARLRARGRLTEVRASDLRFTLEETTAFLNELMELELSAEEAQTLEIRTEGWPAGLRLAALSMQGREDRGAFIAAFAGGHHYVMEYLTEEVLSRQPPAVQAFLTRTSILDQMSAPLCDAVTGSGNGQAMLAYLLNLNLFVIPLDDEHQWFRYHHLFADLLGNRLRQSLPAGEIRELHRRSSVWHTRHGSLDAAVKHGLKAEDYEEVAALVEMAASSSMLGGRLTTLMSWLEALPGETLAAHPRLSVYRGWALFLSGRAEQAEKALLASRHLLQELPSGPDTDPLRGELATMLATIASLSGDAKRIKDEAAYALAHLPEADAVSRARAGRALAIAYALEGDTNGAIEAWREAGELALAGGNIFQAADAIANIGAMQIHQGRLRHAARSYEEVIALSQRPGGRQLPFGSLGYTGLAAIYLEWNRPGEAQDCLEKGAALNRLGGIGYNLAIQYATQAGLQQVMGREEEALAALEKAEQTLAAFPSMPNAVHLASIRGRLRLPTEGAPAIDPDHLPVVLREAHLITLARLALDQDRPEPAIELCEMVLATAVAAGRMARVVEARLLMAIAWDNLGEPGRAQAALSHSLSLAEPEGCMRLYLDEGQPAARLLAGFLRDPSSPAHLRRYADHILAAFESRVSGEQPLLEPLSERELEVMRLVAKGCSNREIAERLVVTLHTVKKHTSNIYGKLGVTSRTQAVARLRDLNLL